MRACIGMANYESTFTKNVADKILADLASGMTLREVCRQDGMPAESTVRQWALDDREGFAAQYARAREIGYQSMADETLEIADDGANDWMKRNRGDDEVWVENGETIGRSRLRVDTRKWMLSKALPKIYGDKVTLGGDPDNPIKTEEVGAGSLKLTAFLESIAVRRGTSGPTDAG